MNKFGFYFSLKFNGLWLMINGRMFSFFKGCNTKKWQFQKWENYWRKNNIKLAINQGVRGD